MTDAERATGVTDETRRVVRVAGDDAEALLQGLLTNDVRRAAADTAVYAALLTPQGKFLFDMIVTRPDPETFLLDVAGDRAEALVKRLTMYRLRAKATIEIDPAQRVVLIWGAPPPAAIPGGITRDPRSEALGWRAITDQPDAALAALQNGAMAAYHALRLEAGVPLSGADLAPEDAFPLDADFERLNGVDFKKGCYVGQEVTARMKHKSERRKRLFKLRFDGPSPAAGQEVTADGKTAGTVGSVHGDRGLAILRVDRVAGGALQAGDAAVVAEPIE